MKKKYNELKDRFEKGVKYLTEHPEESEQYEKKLKDIQNELSEIIEKLNMTEEQIEKGFTLEEVEEECNVIKPETGLQETQIQFPKPNNSIGLEIRQPSNSMAEFKENLQIASQLAKSDLVPVAYQNKPANIVIAIDMANRMGLSPFVVMSSLNIIKGKTAWSRICL